jgi:two-component system, OmpR family, response regulator
VKILIVEDDAVAARLYGQWLLKAGYEIKTAKTGPEALAQVGLWEPDGVLLDLMLPNLNGLEVLTRLRAEASDLPVIICTNAFSAAVRDEGLAAGATRVLDKSLLKSLDLVAEFDSAFRAAKQKRRAA